MAAMRVSLTANFVSHPSIAFGVGRGSSRRPRMGLGRETTVFHRSRVARQTVATIASLRSPTSRFRFPSVGRIGRASPRRAILPLGLPRARRA